jgi:hypothetical protein
MENGVYSYTSTGGTGKTYVANILKKIGDSRVCVVEYNSDENVLEDELERMKRECYDLIYFDRADLIITKEIFEDLVEIGKRATVILDCKEIPDYMDDYIKVASIYYGKKGVRVS